jgi:cobalt/nickel transport system permease protein
MLIDNFAYNNRLKSVHPGEKLAFAFISGVLCFVPNIYVSMAVIFIVAAVLVFKAKIPVRVYLKILFPPIFFLLISIPAVMINVVPAGSDMLMDFALFHMRIGVTYGGLNTAGLLFFRSMGLVSCVYFLALTTPVPDLMMVLKRLKLPVIFLELMHLMYKYLFVLLETAGRIYVSQNSRLGYASLKSTFSSLSMLSSALFIRAYDDAEKFYTALAARCYDGELNVPENDYRIRPKNILLIAAAEMALLLIAFLTGGLFK